MLGLPFREIWAVDFEYIASDGEHPDPVCLVARELRTGQKIRLWRDQMRGSPPYDISKDSLFVSFASDAEMGCHLALGWPLPSRVLDLRVEFLQAINFTPRPPPDKNKEKKRGSLLHALTYYGLDGIEAVEKERWRKLILSGGPWTNTEREGIWDYCESDVRAIHQLFAAMVRRGDVSLDGQLKFGLYRGRYMRAVTRMTFVGVPIDLERFNRLVNRWDAIEMQLIETLGKHYEVYDEEGSFSEKRFIRYLNERGIGWPVHESGRLDTKEKTFKMMAQLRPELEPLRQLEYCRKKLKLRKLSVGRDGYNRVWLAPFASRTSRNQPSNSGFIFGPAVWLRDFLIQAKPGWGIAYLDWAAQEFGVAAGLSGDPAMREAYESGDIYMAFGKQAGVLRRGQLMRRTACNEISLKFVFWRHSTGKNPDHFPNRLISPTSSAGNFSGFITKFIATFGTGRIIGSIGTCSATNNGQFSAGAIVSGNSRRLIPSAISICKPTGRKCSAWPVAWAPKLGFRSVLQFMTRF